MAVSLFVSLLAVASFFPPLAVAGLKTLSLDFEVKRPSLEGRRSRLRDVVGGNISNLKIEFLANITVGTPPQHLTVVLDTGTGINGFTDDVEQSSTSKQLRDLFSIIYADLTGANGTFITDTFGFNSITMENIQIGLALIGTKKSSANAVGVWGIGFENAEADILRFHESAYPGIVSEMKRNGYIHTQAYSIWLGGYDENFGQIVFGGVDASKYTGPLDLLPVVDAPVSGTDLQRLSIQMTSLALHQDNGVSEILLDNTVVRVLLDTGTTFCYFPKSIIDRLYASVGAEFPISGRRDPFVDCSLRSTKAAFIFGFGGSQGSTISVPVSEMVLPSLGETLLDGRPACQLGAYLSSPVFIILGDTFLRSAYIVYDLENKRIALAQAATNVDITQDLSGVKEITPGLGGIPGVQRTLSALPWPPAYTEEWQNYTHPSNRTNSSSATPSSFALLPAPPSNDSKFNRR
ncbi:MAG: hypothetical protein Q9202_005119 [Teloschistes flavicans]